MEIKKELNLEIILVGAASELTLGSPGNWAEVVFRDVKPQDPSL